MLPLLFVVAGLCLMDLVVVREASLPVGGRNVVNPAMLKSFFLLVFGVELNNITVKLRTHCRALLFSGERSAIRVNLVDWFTCSVFTC